MATNQAGPQEGIRDNSERQPQPQEAPQPPSLLDKIISETQVAQRDALIVRRAEFDQKQRLAKMFSTSGCFQDIDKDENGAWLSQEVSIARAMVKIELGESMGFSAAESMTGIDIIKGRVAVGASLRGARMQRAGFSWPQMIVTDKGCWMPLCYKGEPMMCPKVNEEGQVVSGPDGQPVMVQVVVAFTEKDAKSLGLLDKNQSMYKKDPSSMYYARTVTRAQRRYGPGVLGIDVLDTYEARDAESGQQEDRRCMAVSLSVDQFRASSDQNRGHDQTNPAAEPEKPAETATAEPEKKEETPLVSKPRGSKGTPAADTETKEEFIPTVKYARNEMPDPFEMTVGLVAEYDGKIWQVVEDGDTQKWVERGVAKIQTAEQRETSKNRGFNFNRGAK